MLAGTIVSDGGFKRHLAHEGQVLRFLWHAWEFLLPDGVTLTQPTFYLISVPVVIEEGTVFVQWTTRKSGEAPASA